MIFLIGVVLDDSLGDLRLIFLAKLFLLEDELIFI